MIQKIVINQELKNNPMMTPQSNPQEKKCICIAITGHYHDCPLYTPPAQEEKKETCCSGSTECTCLVKQPPQLAKDKKCQAAKCENLAEFERYSSTLDGFGIKTGMMRLFKVCKEHSVEPPQQKEHLAQEEKVYFAPTPTAATESFLFDLFLKHELKELETWEEKFDEYSTGKRWEADKNMFLVLATVFEIKTFIRKELTTARAESETRGWNAAIEAALKSFQVEDYTTLCIKKILNSLKKPL